MKTHHKYNYIKYIVIVLIAVCTQHVQAQQPTSLLQHVIQERPLLADLLTKAGLAPMLSADAPVTLLAPPEAELESIRQEQPERLRAILSNHILSGTYKEGDLKDGATLKTVGGTGITICRKTDHTLVNGVRIQQPDQQLKNGMLHGISGLIQM